MWRAAAWRAACGRGELAAPRPRLGPAPSAAGAGRRRRPRRPGWRGRSLRRSPGPVVASTLGVEAHDFGGFVLRLTRTAVPAGNLTIFFRNYDSSKHNLWLIDRRRRARIRCRSATTSARRLGATKTVAVTPGSWRLYCSLAGHSSMTRDLAVG